MVVFCVGFAVLSIKGGHTPLKGSLVTNHFLPRHRNDSLIAIMGH